MRRSITLVLAVLGAWCLLVWVLHELGWVTYEGVRDFTHDWIKPIFRRLPLL